MGHMVPTGVTKSFSPGLKGPSGFTHMEGRAQLELWTKALIHGFSSTQTCFGNQYDFVITHLSSSSTVTPLSLY